MGGWVVQASDLKTQPKRVNLSLTELQVTGQVTGHRSTVNRLLLPCRSTVNRLLLSSPGRRRSDWLWRRFFAQRPGTFAVARGPNRVGAGRVAPAVRGAPRWVATVMDGRGRRLSPGCSPGPGLQAKLGHSGSAPPALRGRPACPPSPLSCGAARSNPRLQS